MPPLRNRRHTGPLTPAVHVAPTLSTALQLHYISVSVSIAVISGFNIGQALKRSALFRISRHRTFFLFYKVYRGRQTRH